MLWLTLKFLAPKSSAVVDTEAEDTAPVHIPIMAVLMWRHMLLPLRSKKKAPVIGTIINAIKAGLEILYLALKQIYYFVSKLLKLKMLLYCLVGMVELMSTKKDGSKWDLRLNWFSTRKFSINKIKCHIKWACNTQPFWESEL